MIKSTKLTNTTTLYTQASFSFYVPHTRSETWFTGEIKNPVTGEITTPPSMTKQEFLESCDINNIIKSYKVTGQIHHINAQAAQGAYRDLPDPIDFQEAQNTVIAARDSFATLPSQVRDRFHNDPGEFLAFMSDPGNQDEAIKLGLATKRPVPAPEPTPTPEPEPKA